MVEKKYLSLGRKIRDKLNNRGANLDYYAGTIIASIIQKSSN